MRLVVRRRAPRVLQKDFVAFSEDFPGFTAEGDTEVEALGKLISFHASTLGIEVVRSEEPRRRGLFFSGC